MPAPRACLSPRTPLGKIVEPNATCLARVTAASAYVSTVPFAYYSSQPTSRRFQFCSHPHSPLAAPITTSPVRARTRRWGSIFSSFTPHICGSWWSEVGNAGICPSSHAPPARPPACAHQVGTRGAPLGGDHIPNLVSAVCLPQPVCPAATPASTSTPPARTLPSLPAHLPLLFRFFCFPPLSTSFHHHTITPPRHAPYLPPYSPSCLSI